jgi:hypothetical protein
MNNSFRRLWAGILTGTAGWLLFFSSSLAQVKFYSPLEEAVARGAKLEVADPAKVPTATFWSLQREHYPPVPYNPFPELPLYYLGHGNFYLVDDSTVDYAALEAQREEERQMRMMALDFGLLGLAEYYELEGGGEPMALYSYATNDLWIELWKYENDTAFLTLHGTEPDEHYQLERRSELAPGQWQLGEIITGATGTNQTDFAPLDVPGLTNQFFRAHHANPQITVVVFEPGYEGHVLVPSNQPGSFGIYTANNDPLTVYYRMSGVASNGVDYTLLNGVAQVPANQSYTTVEYYPITDNLLEGTETIILTVIPTNTYLITPEAASATNFISDSAMTVSVQRFFGDDAIEADGPPGESAVAGVFRLTRTDGRNLWVPLAVRYTLAGTAGNGTDYTSLSGTVTFAAGATETNVFIQPISDTLVEGLETVTLTLLPTNTYVINPDAASAELTIADSSTTVGIRFPEDATEPNPQSATPGNIGKVTLLRSDLRTLPALTVSYQISGTAGNGVDYTNLTGTVTIPASEPSVDIFIEPRFDDELENDETVTVTLTHVSDGYLINPDFASATLTIFDNRSTNLFAPVVAGLSLPTGLDYHQPSNSLIVSVNGSLGEPRNFTRIFTNNSGATTIGAWSGVHGEPDEIKLVTVKTTQSGFTNGDLFYSSGTGIGWVSPTGTRSNLNWAILTNGVFTNFQLVRGGLCLDTTGLFSNRLVAVVSDDQYVTNSKGIWLVNAQQQTTFLTNLSTTHLEGAIVMPNDVNQWGPWAEKIITGDENTGIIFAIATNGVVSQFDLGIRPEDFDLIPTNQDLYVCDVQANSIAKLSRSYLTNFVGQLLITEAGEFGGANEGKVFVVKWNSGSGQFEKLPIAYRRRDGGAGILEHVTFAPLSLPVLPP